MRSSKRKSPATEGKRKTTASDKAHTSVIKSVSKKKTVTVENDGSYIQSHVSHSAPISTIAPSESEQTHISTSMGQAILAMLNQIKTSNKDVSSRMDQLELNSTINSTPLTYSSLHCRRSRTVAATHQCCLDL